MAKKKTKPKKSKVKLVYFGKTDDTHDYVEYDHIIDIELENNWKRRCWTKPLQKGQFIGGVYEFDCERQKNDGLLVTINSGKFVKSLVATDRFGDLVVKLCTMAKASADEKACRRSDPMADTLEPIRDAYKRLSAAKQRALINAVTRYIMTGKK